MAPSPLATAGVHVEKLAQPVLRTTQNSVQLNGAEITVMCQEYMDRTLVLVTQQDKVGYLVRGDTYAGASAGPCWRADGRVPPVQKPRCHAGADSVARAAVRHAAK